MESRQKNEITFLPGTVVLQSVNDGERCVAVVVGDHMIDRLSKRDRELFEMHRDNGRFHILLVLSYFCDHDDRWSTFAKYAGFRFPTYIVEEKRTATRADLSNEIALLLRHKNEKPSRGLHTGKLHAYMFSFTEKQEEALELVALVEHYSKGGAIENLPEWIKQYSKARETVMEELAIACPR